MTMKGTPCASISTANFKVNVTAAGCEGQPLVMNLDALLTPLVTYPPMYSLVYIA